MVKFSTYATLSVMSVLAMVCHAVRTRQQFYLVMLYLSHSKISLALLINLGLVLMCISWQVISNIFLGPLREAEVERLSEHFWREIMEILFAMTVFRDELHLQFMFWISVLLFFKMYHWLVQKRVEYIETTPSMEHLSHVRLCTFMALLLTLDCLCFHRSFSHLLKTRQPSVSLFFAFEYAILATATISICIKYALHVREIFYEGHSTGKDVYVFYVELVQDLLHLSLYLLFFLVIFIHYGLPLHLVRELYETFQNFKTRVSDFIRYRRLTTNMNDNFQDPTPEELSRDATCIICREEMIEAKKLPCGHLFHIHCLRSWLERQYSCPTCRAPLLGSEDESELEQFYEDDEDIAFDIPDYEDNFMGDEDANLHEEDENIIDGNGENDPNLTQSQEPTTISNTQQGQSYPYLAFTDGTKTWYPVFVPMFPQPLPWVASICETKAHPRSEDFYGTMEQTSPFFPKISNIQHPNTHQWPFVPRILQIHQNSDPSCFHTPSTSTNRHEGFLENDRTTPSSSTSQSLAQIVTWNPGRFDISGYEEQNAYLDRVVEVLRGQLQSAIDLQQKLKSIHARDHVKKSSPSMEVTGCTGSINTEVNLAREVDVSSSHNSNSDIDARDQLEKSCPLMEVPRDTGNKNSEQNCAKKVDMSNFHNLNSHIQSTREIAIQHVKDHCKHCPQTPSTANSLDNRNSDKH